MELNKIDKTVSNLDEKIENLGSKLIIYLGFGLLITSSIDIIWHISKGEIINLSGIIASAGTLTIAYIAVKGYGKIVLNKAREEQLAEVIKLVKDIRREGVITVNHPDISFGVNFIEILNDEYIEKYLQITINEIEKTEICDLSIKGYNYQKLMDSLPEYTNNAIIPKKIAIEVKELIEKLTEINSKELRKDLTIEPTDQSSLLVIDYFCLKSTLLSLTSTIKNWLEDNNIKDVNLPDLDQTNTHSKES